MSSSEDEFEEQLRQEKLEKATEEDDNSGRTRVDPDGTVYEWDSQKKAWFPKIDADFIAQYQMSYGSGTQETAAETTTAPTSVSDYYNYYSTKTSDTSTIPTDSEAYRQWYEYYYGSQAQPTQQSGDQKDDNTSEDVGDKVESCSNVSSEDIPAPPDDTNSQEYYDWYFKYYDQPTEGEYDWAKYYEYYGYQADGTEKTEAGKDATDVDEKGKRKRKPPEPPSWFDVAEDQKNTTVYVSGLPEEMSDEDFKDLMNKCGLIMFDPLTRKPKLKLYKDQEGNNKGDGRCCYIKPESVELALQILDGSEYHGHKIYVEIAKFEMKGKFDPSKKRRKLTKHEKKKFQQKQEKLFDWRPDKLVGERKHSDKVVILKNAFDAAEFEKDPLQINEVKKDIRKEAAKFGDVRKVVIYDRHTEGVVGITFSEPSEADVCIEAMNGRWFAKQQITAAAWDGRTKFTVKESGKEKKDRLQNWEQYLEGDDDKDGAKKQSTEVAVSDSTQTGDNTVQDKKPDSQQSTTSDSTQASDNTVQVKKQDSQQSTTSDSNQTSNDTVQDNNPDSPNKLSSSGDGVDQSVSSAGEQPMDTEVTHTVVTEPGSPSENSQAKDTATADSCQSPAEDAAASESLEN